ncbi:coagulation factor IXa isoform X2 [Lampris incognitus]|nr:coagulation factor IXa isoform X2 [Lampris incognitus]
MAFWAGYVDGDQCKSSPCHNEGTCQDSHGFYICRCPSGFTGRNCEISTVRRCDLNNGDCMHFCEVMGTFGAKCSCADGYLLAQDGVTCEPNAEFPCGRNILTVILSRSSRSLLSDVNANQQDLASPTNISTTAPPVLPSASTAVSSPASNASVVANSFNKQLLWVHNQEPPRSIKRIVGGDAVIPGEIPWQVALVARPTSHFFCGGSILNELWVITAAHCLGEGQISFFIRTGDHNILTNEGTEQDHEVLEQHIHPRYDTTVSRYNHDIALLRLKSPINFSDMARPICLGPKSFTESLVKAASPAIVSGWGRTRFLGLTADTLLKVEVPFTDRTECKDSSSDRITRYMFCAGYDSEAKDACQGDSGGPHTNRYHNTWFLTGIVSWGEECAKDGKYGVYTRVSHYYRWIHYVIRDTNRRLEADVDEPDL